jgi:hypothetical protein
VQAVLADESVFRAPAKIASHDYVLVQATDKTSCGIVTASDFNFQFQVLAEARKAHSNFRVAKISEQGNP